VRALSPSARPLLVLVLAGLLSTSCSTEQERPAAAVPPGSSTAPSEAATAAAPPSTAAPSTAPTPAASADDTTMTIASFEYDVPASVRPGEPITVVNQDREAHTVTIDRGAVRLTVPGGGTATFAAPSQVGDHPVVCDFHGGMQAVLVVA
jgi:plastocyanin